MWQPENLERYCNAYRGVFMAFLPTVSGKMMAHRANQMFAEHIFERPMVAAPGRTSGGIDYRKDTVMRLCKIRKQPFIY